jgi:hypothetical protein
LSTPRLSGDGIAATLMFNSFSDLYGAMKRRVMMGAV